MKSESVSHSVVSNSLQPYCHPAYLTSMQSTSWETLDWKKYKLESVILLLLSLFILEKAPNYKNRDITDKTNLVINNNNITAYLKKDIIIENDCIYLSKQDIANFFDPYIYFNEDENRIVITYDTKVTNMFLDDTSITINDRLTTIDKTAFEQDDVIYIPFSELSESFNMDLKYNKDTDIITVDTLSKEQIKATATKNLSVKSMKDTFSRTITKVKKNPAIISHNIHIPIVFLLSL